MNYYLFMGSIWCKFYDISFMFKFVAVIIIYMMLLCPYFIFIDTSLSKHVDMFFDFGFSLEDKRGLSLGSWYVHFASWFPIVVYNVFMHNNALWSISNAFSLIICKVCSLHKEGECRQLEFWTWKSYVRVTYSAQLQMSWKFTENCFAIYEKYWSK